MSDTVRCPTCGDEYKSIGSHWNHNPSHVIKFTTKQKRVLAGTLAADGTLPNRSNTPYLQIGSIQPEYLKHLDDLFPTIGRGVVEVKTAKESAQSAANSGFSTVADEDNYSKVYRWRTVSHPHFNRYTEWYDNGKKNWVDTDITLYPTTLKHIFCGDGHYDGNRISISSSNLSSEEKKKLNNKFSSVDIEISSIYEQSVSEDCVKQNIIFTREESKKVFSYMGKALPGFEYKWPNRKI